MRKIKLVLTPAQLLSICFTLVHLKYEAGPTRQEQAQRSIMDLVGKKLLKKQIDQPERDVSLTLHFHEADLLETYLREYAESQQGDFTRHQIYMVADDLNQKLA